jgi:hypothetical protein
MELFFPSGLLKNNCQMLDAYASSLFRHQVILRGPEYSDKPALSEKLEEAAKIILPPLLL